MAKGKKTDNVTIYKVMLSYITTNNYNETARQLNMPESTVRHIVDENRDKEEFTKLCAKKKEEFAERAKVDIEKINKEEFVEKHYLDSLAAAGLKEMADANNILDSKFNIFELGIYDPII